MRPYIVSNWYWTVGGDLSRWWSSRANAYVAPVPQWVGDGGIIGDFPDEQSLSAMLARNGLPGPVPVAPTAEQTRMAAYKADPTRQNLVTLIQGSTPAQVANWLSTNVTTLAQARAVLGQLILLIGGNSVQ